MQKSNSGAPALLDVRTITNGDGWPMYPRLSDSLLAKSNTSRRPSLYHARILEGQLWLKSRVSIASAVRLSRLADLRMRMSITNTA